LLGKATVTVAEVGTQTRSVAEELWDLKTNWAEGGKVTFKKASPELFPPPRPVYDQFQIQLGRIKTAGREIEKFKELFRSRASLPAGIESTLEADFRYWQEELQAAEDAFWELNCPNPALRAQERLRANLRRAANQRGYGDGSVRPRPPPPPGPPPPLEIFNTPTAPLPVISAAKILPATPQVIIESFEHNKGGQVRGVDQAGRVGISREGERISIKARLQLPADPPSRPLEPNPRIQEIKEKENQSKEGEKQLETKSSAKGEGLTPP